MSSFKGSGPADDVELTVREAGAKIHYGSANADLVRSTDGWRALVDQPEALQVEAAVIAFQRGAAALIAFLRAADPYGAGTTVEDRERERSNWFKRTAYLVVGQELLRRKLTLTAEHRVGLLTALLSFAPTHNHGARPPTLSAEWDPTKSVLRALERGGQVERLAEEFDLLRTVREALSHDGRAESTRCIARVDALLGLTEEDQLFSRAGRWSAAMEKTVAQLSSQQAAAARDAIRHAQTASQSQPSAKFLDDAVRIRDQHGADVLVPAVTRLLAESAFSPSADHGQVDAITGDVVRGLCGIATTLPSGDELAVAVRSWLVAGWAKVPGRGPACRKAAASAAWALARLGDAGAAQLGAAASLVKQPQARAEIDAAIDDAASTLGIPRDEFEERVVPTMGLTAPARMERQFGNHAAALTYEAGQVRVEIRGPDGKVRKTVPATVKQDHADELTGLKSLAKDATSMLAAQRLRLERLLFDDRDWPPDVWRERYLDHPLVSAIARNLIWIRERPGGQTAFVARDGLPRAIDGATVDLGSADRVRLWHPATAATDEVGEWRRAIEDLQIVQPFKQAHREVYLLTEAERQTDIYSNRFAGHILRQHQFAALARSRDWRYALQGSFDTPDENSVLHLPRYGLHVAFWVDRPWGAENDINDTGIFNHILTDQVRFSAEDSEDVRLADVPVRVFSEVMRDVDLFVGVASIGNDPTWQDSGDARREWNRYWQSYSFGELGAAAEVRRDLLGRLLPKLAIADVASLDGRFLRVQGRVRTYRIHLGSGNILMEPNDQYLCIVPGRGDVGAKGIMLPFEGDQMLSIVLSKALLLANDDEITDQTITSQLHRL